MTPRKSAFDALNGSAGHAVAFANGGAGQSLFKQGADNGNVGFNQFVPAKPLAAHVRSGDVPPVMARNHIVYGFGGNAVLARKITPVFAGRNALENVGNVSLGQLCGACIAANISTVKVGIVSVLDVFRSRDPLKIFRSVVQFVAVDVVDLMLRTGSGADKGHNDKTMQHHRALLVADANGSNGQIAAPVTARHRIDDAILGTSRTARHALDATKRACRVIAFPAGNFFPLFHPKQYREAVLTTR